MGRWSGLMGKGVGVWVWGEMLGDLIGGRGEKFVW